MVKKLIKGLSAGFAAVVAAAGMFFAALAPVPNGPLPFTGDNTPFKLIFIAMGAALVVIVVILVSSFRKK